MRSKIWMVFTKKYLGYTLSLKFTCSVGHSWPLCLVHPALRLYSDAIVDITLFYYGKNGWRVELSHNSKSSGGGRDGGGRGGRDGGGGGGHGRGGEAWEVEGDEVPVLGAARAQLTGAGLADSHQGRALGQLKYLSDKGSLDKEWVRGELGTHSSRCSNSNIRLKQRNNANSLGYRCISNGRNEPSMVRHGFMGQMMSFPSDVAGMPMSPVDAQRPGSVQTLASALASADPEHQKYQGKMKSLVMMIVQCKSNWLHFITVYLQEVTRKDEAAGNDDCSDNII
ncbi:hypothetical protein MKW98_010909 [Papaver atlanticum]|uniref:Uncharacterized protein n=1 Tax=Papaver atlanticum TaxID=357466 RepID=A0AAD4SKP0_9MAGN|nr:hypothetical protein MKW98_010909 [Papaver atlanticum]